MATAWGARTIDAVNAGGVATQLFPVGAPAASMVSTVAGYPPASSGKVRRPVYGRLTKLDVTGDGVNSGVVELWDVGGTDRGAAPNNVNNGDTLTDAYLTANGILVQKINVPGVGGTPFTIPFEAINFSKGLAVRFIVVGATAGKTVSIAPFVEGGFMVQEVIA